MMKIKSELQKIEQGNVSYLQWKRLSQKGIINAFTLKGLNFRNREDLLEEYIVLLEALHIPAKCLVKPSQTHSDHILVIKEKERKEDADIHLDYLNGVDALITNQKNIALASTSADCLCIVLYDTQKQVLANIHSGWRGTFQKIASKTLQKMKQTYGTDAKEVEAYFMPAIRQCHFEVEEDVKTACQDIFAYTNRLDEIIHVGRVWNGVQKYQIDTILLNQIMLEEEGVLPEHIWDSELCSVCDCNVIHSRRAEGENFGLGTTVVMMT